MKLWEAFKAYFKTTKNFQEISANLINSQEDSLFILEQTVFKEKDLALLVSLLGSNSTTSPDNSNQLISAILSETYRPSYRVIASSSYRLREDIAKLNSEEFEAIQRLQIALYQAWNEAQASHANDIVSQISMISNNILSNEKYPFLMGTQVPLVH